MPMDLTSVIEDAIELSQQEPVRKTPVNDPPSDEEDAAANDDDDDDEEEEEEKQNESTKKRRLSRPIFLYRQFLKLLQHDVLVFNAIIGSNVLQTNLKLLWAYDDDVHKCLGTIGEDSLKQNNIEVGQMTMNTKRKLAPLQQAGGGEIEALLDKRRCHFFMLIKTYRDENPSTLFKVSDFFRHVSSAPSFHLDKGVKKHPPKRLKRFQLHEKVVDRQKELHLNLTEDEIKQVHLKKGCMWQDGRIKEQCVQCLAWLERGPRFFYMKKKPKEPDLVWLSRFGVGHEGLYNCVSKPCRACNV
jgi:hypothetical protein